MLISWPGERSKVGSRERGERRAGGALAVVNKLNGNQELEVAVRKGTRGRALRRSPNTAFPDLFPSCKKASAFKPGSVWQHMAHDFQTECLGSWEDFLRIGRDLGTSSPATPNTALFSYLMNRCTRYHQEKKAIDLVNL